MIRNLAIIFGKEDPMGTRINTFGVLLNTEMQTSIDNISIPIFVEEYVVLESSDFGMHKIYHSAP